MVAATMGVLLIAALMASPNGNRRAPTALASLDKPIPTRAIVIADAPPAPSFQSAKPIANAKPATAAKPVAGAHVHLAAAPAPHPRPADPAPQVVAALVAPAPEPERSFDIRKRLFAPVSFVRDNVARLMSWP
jgi:hypothetical protein